jgi:hypothetical protein
MSPALGERRRLCGLRSTVPVTRLPVLVLSVSVSVSGCVFVCARVAVVAYQPSNLRARVLDRSSVYFPGS